MIVPVFNGRQFLPRCLDAIQRSSFRQFELIVVDDASTDEGPEIARSHGARVLSLPDPERPRRRPQSRGALGVEPDRRSSWMPMS